MKNLISTSLTLLVLLVGSRTLAQDVIILKNGEEIKAMVKQVSQTEITYNRYENLSGPAYVIKKSDVFMIRYQNGTKDVFGAETTTQAGKSATQQTISDNDIHRARKASTWGYILTAPIMILGVAAATAEEAEVGVALGALATATGAVGIPLVAGGGKRLRLISGVDGNRGLRIAGWISYGVALADAVYLVALGASGEDTGTAGIPVAILGSLSSVCMAVDASQTANQSQALRTGASRTRFQPFIGSARDPLGKYHTTLGLRIRL